MKSLSIAVLVAASAGVAHAGADPTVWSGYDVSFSKTAFGSEQDDITGNVSLTRSTVRGIFNIAQETGYVNFSSPADTVWAFGNASDYASLTFNDWETTVGSNPPGMVGQDMVVWMLTDNVVMDLRFTAWGVGAGAGGSFSYVRAVPAPGVAGVLGLAGLGAMRRRR